MVAPVQSLGVAQLTDPLAVYVTLLAVDDVIGALETLAFTAPPTKPATVTDPIGALAHEHRPFVDAAHVRVTTDGLARDGDAIRGAVHAPVVFGIFEACQSPR
jgi:hypothetical protein